MAKEGSISGGKAKAKGTKEVLSLDRRLAKALSHSLRVEILKLLNEGEWSPRRMSDELNEGLSNVSYHVGVLRDFELIELTKTVPRRGAVEHFYRALERPFVRAGQVDCIPKSAQGAIVVGRIREIDEDLNPALETGSFWNRDDWHASRTPMPLDDQGRAELEKDADAFVDKALSVSTASAERLASGESDGEVVWTTVALLVFSSSGNRDGSSGATRQKRRAKKK